MFDFLKRLLYGEKCYFCQHPTRDKRYYRDDKGDKIAVCYKCAPYAENRAYRRFR